MRAQFFLSVIFICAISASLQSQSLVQSYSLIVLNESYDNFEELNGISASIESTHEILTRKFGFESELLRNASLQQFLSALRVYSKRDFGTTDQMLVYLTAHVYHDSVFNMRYLAFPNSDTEDVGTMIPLTELLVMVGNIACKHILLILDDGPIWDFDKTIEKTAYLNISTLDGYADDDVANRLIYKTRKYIYLNSTDNNRNKFHSSISAFLSSQDRSVEVAGIKDFIRFLNRSDLGTSVYLGPFLTDEPAGEFLFQYR